jgi:hypothetical protein
LAIAATAVSPIVNETAEDAPLKCLTGYMSCGPRPFPFQWSGFLVLEFAPRVCPTIASIASCGNGEQGCRASLLGQSCLSKQTANPVERQKPNLCELPNPRKGNVGPPICELLRYSILRLLFALILIDRSLMICEFDWTETKIHTQFFSIQSEIRHRRLLAEPPIRRCCFQNKC